MGQQHGEQAQRQIRQHIDYICSSLKLTKPQVQHRAMQFESLFQQYSPHLIEELRGLAEGAGIAYAESLAVNIRGALTMSNDGGCTAFAITKSGTRDQQVLIGQNSDQLPATLPLGYVLHVKPTDKPESLMWTFGGMIGYHGINSLGVGHFANDLGGGPAARFGMPHYPPKRLILECSTMVEIKRLLQRTSFWASGNYVLCDGHGEILDIEATPDGQETIDDSGRGFICHSNHFLSPKYATQINFQNSAKDSFTRLERINQLISQSFGTITVDNCKSILRDQHNSPCGICRTAQTDHPEANWVTAGITVASIVAEPARGRLHIACGNDPSAPYVEYDMG